MTLMPHSIFKHYIEQRFQVNFRRIRVPAYLVCPDGRTSWDAVLRPDVRCGSMLSKKSFGGNKPRSTSGLIRWVVRTKIALSA